MKNEKLKYYYIDGYVPYIISTSKQISYEEICMHANKYTKVYDVEEIDKWEALSYMTSDSLSKPVEIQNI